MVLAAYGDNLYKILLLFHILSFVVAFAPAVINPVLAAQTRSDGESELIRVAGHMAKNGRRIHFPALLALGGFGILLVLQSSDVWDFDQTWVGLAILVWLALCGAITGLVLPAERSLAAGDLSAEAKVALGGQLATVLALAMLYLMIWKPGL